MKMDEMNPAERRAYDKLAKAKSRKKQADAAELARIEALIPDAHDYLMPAYRIAQLEIVLADTIIAIAAQHQLSYLDEYVIHGVVSATFGFENRIFKVVQSPPGMFIGGQFADFVAANAVEHVHLCPEILESQVFTELYHRFLELTAAWFKTPAGLKHGDAGFAKTVAQELEGTYCLPAPRTKPVPAVPPAVVTDGVPPQSEILHRGALQTMTQIEIQERGQAPQAGSFNPADALSEEARRYLRGT